MFLVTRHSSMSTFLARLHDVEIEKFHCIRLQTKKEAKRKTDLLQSAVMFIAKMQHNASALYIHEYFYINNWISEWKLFF